MRYDPCNWTHLFLIKVPKTYKREKIVSSTNVAEKTGYLM
jgi:hypothetical protein